MNGWSVHVNRETKYYLVSTSLNLVHSTIIWTNSEATIQMAPIEFILGVSGTRAIEVVQQGSGCRELGSTFCPAG
jgi:hypothetical protein